MAGLSRRDHLLADLGRLPAAAGRASPEVTHVTGG
jgi:hypothetical protein